MSNLNITGVVENVPMQANVYTPIIEAIVNSIQAIGDSKRKDGEINVTIKRSEQATLGLDDALPEISNIEIEDNGIGFNQENRDSFDELFSDLKKDKYGCKGFGRFMFLKYFESVEVKSVFKFDNSYSYRVFDFGKGKKIIENESVTKSNEKDTKTVLLLKNLKEGKLDKKLTTIARKVLEKLLIYFIRDDYQCPKITLKEDDGTEIIVLNEYLTKDGQAAIKEVSTQEFALTNKEHSEKFQLKIFKIFFPHNQRSRISLTAYNREVTSALLHHYVPEFEDDFYEDFSGEEGTVRKDFFIKSYVLGDYLNTNVTLERESFKFSEKTDLFFPFSQEDIEKEVAKLTQEFFGDDIKTRKDKKKAQIYDYVNTEAPWHKEYLEDLDLAMIPYSLSDELIEQELHKTKFRQERIVKAEAKRIIDSPDQEIDESVQELVKKISKAEMSELAHYVALRKTILGLFKKSLEKKPDGNYAAESIVHNIIFPTRSDSDTTPYKRHNLWIIDEKLSFTEYLSSDQPIDGGKTERTDILVFNKKMAFRAENEASNPITIFEFKKPQRDDFVNPSSKEDPVQQIVRYVNDIKDGKYKTPNGRDILIGTTTPFYGFVVCDLNKKVKDWLLKEKDFKPMPDGEGWFQWFSNINLFIEVISWDKMLKDAEMRNKIFFHKLGID